jgi:hypothetical protein
MKLNVQQGIIFLLTAFFLSGCGFFGDDSCKELEPPEEIRGMDLERYNTKFTIEFVDSVDYEQAKTYLEKLGYPFEYIGSSAFVVESGCGQPAEHFYTNYGTEEQISLGDSSYVEYVNPVFYFREADADYMLKEIVGVQFDESLEFERIAEIVNSLNLQFREYDYGAYKNLYLLIVPKKACCNAIGMAEILLGYDEVKITDPLFSFTIPNPTLNQYEETTWNDLSSY